MDTTVDEAISLDQTPILEVVRRSTSVQIPFRSARISATSSSSLKPSSSANSIDISSFVRFEDRI